MECRSRVRASGCSVRGISHDLEVSALTLLLDFVLSKVTPDMVSDLDWKLFMMFATIDIGGLGTFAL